MEQKVPRLVLAGTNSGCGKTTVTCAVLQALVTRGLRVGAAKCGPDYIDPMFHSRVIGAKSSNLDPFFFDRDTMRYLLAHNSQGCDVTVIEGVMGYYDGLGLTSTRASTYEAARETESPVVLVVNARGAALSVLAAAEGFLRFAPDSGIRGVILNGCSAMSYGPLARELENRLGVRTCGYLPRLPECALESRHLGLITADEVADLQEKLRRLAAELADTPEAEAFCQTLPHRYFEEYNLHGCLLEKRRSYDAVIEGLDALLPYVDNWATCDMISPPVFKKRPPALIGQIRVWLASDRIYTVRFGLRTLMAHFLDDAFAPSVLELAAAVRSEEYYLRMMVAWFFATALAKQYDAALPYIRECRLDVWTHNKAIQKAVESRRIPDGTKAYLRTLRRKNTAEHV